MPTSGSGPQVPLVPIANLGNLYINGARLTYLTNTTFSVGSGQVRDALDINDIIVGGQYYNAGGGGPNSPQVGATVTVNTALQGVGGIDTGTVAASTVYAVYAVGDSRGFNNGAAVMSLNLTAPLMPAGYDMYRYIGSVSIDAASHIRPFVQSGAQTLRTMWFDPGTGPSTTGVVIPNSAVAGSTGYANVGVFTTLLPQKAVECLLSVGLTPNAAGNALYLAPPTIDNGKTATVGSVANLSAEVTGHAQLSVLRVPCSLPNATQQAALAIGNVVTVLYATTAALDAVTFALTGYVDQL